MTTMKARDDVANAVCGVCYLLRTVVKQPSIAAIHAGNQYDPTQDPRSDVWWGNRYYGIRPRGVNLPIAPRRSEPSHALQELREASERHGAHERAQVEAHRAHLELLAAEAKSEQLERDAQALEKSLRKGK